jgi:hypothetical protein
LHQHSLEPSTWPFAEPTNAAAFATTRVVYDDLPVLVVSHDEDGEWQFLCGTTTESSDCVIVCLGCAYERDLMLAGVADLPPGWQAQRSHIGALWERYPSTPEAQG